MASARPGTSRSITRRVASGVTSLGPKPVPPAVKISSYSWWQSSWSSVAMASALSGTSPRPMVSSGHSVPSNLATAGPVVSICWPAEHRSEMVTTAKPGINVILTDLGCLRRYNWLTIGGSVSLDSIFGFVSASFHEKAGLCQRVRFVPDFSYMWVPPGAIFHDSLSALDDATIKPSDERTDPRVGKNRWMRQS